MSASEANHEPTLFDQTPRASAEPAHDTRAPREPREPSEPSQPQAAAAAPDAEHSEESEAEPAAADSALDASSAEGGAQPDRKRIAEQLDALKRKESELRRALAVADHPELADAIRTIEGRAYALARAETKLAQGFSKSEARRREVIEKKLGALREKRAELDSQITTFETELAGLGSDRMATFEGERRAALEQLFVAIATHDPALSAAGLDANGLIPELAGWMPELEALAKTVSERAEPLSR